MPPTTSPEDKEDNSFPTKQLAVLAVARFAEPIAFTSIVAYNYVFVQDLRPGDDENAAFYAGLLISAFALAEAAAAMPWGMVSDRIGRKPVVLFGLTGVAVSNLIFGFATNYWVAFGARVLGGLLNGNVAVMQTMVAEMCKKPEHEPRAYTMIPFMWSVGSIFGAAMGGYLAQPAQMWPLFKHTLFEKFPYLLPNVVAAAYIVFAILIGIGFLEETHVPPRQHLSAKLDLADERTPLIDSETTFNDADESGHIKGRRPSIASETPLTLSATLDIRRISMSTTTESVRPIATTEDSEAMCGDDEPGKDNSVPKQGYSRPMVLLIVQLFLMSYHQMGFSSLNPVFLLDEPSEDMNAQAGLDLRGGLGYSIRDVGTFMAINGVMAMLIQVAFFPPFVAKNGVWKSFVWMTAQAPLVYVFVPFLTAVARPQLPFAVYAVLFLQLFASIIIYPCLLIALKNETPTLSMLGQVNGLAMAGCCAARTMAPPVAGFFYSKGGQAAGWWSVGSAAIFAAILLFFMKPPPQETPSGDA